MTSTKAAKGDPVYLMLSGGARESKSRGVIDLTILGVIAAPLGYCN